MNIKRIFLIVIILSFFVLQICLFSNCFGIESVTPPTGSGTANLTKLKASIENAWGVARTILQVLALSTLTFAGIKYMLTSPDKKADIKKSLGLLIIGALITFGSTIVIQVIIKVFEDITNT